MKTLKLISIRLLLASGLFFNATAQGDVAIVDINRVTNDSNKVTNTYSKSEAHNNIYNASVLALADGSVEVAKIDWIEKQNRVSLATLPKSVIKTLVKEYEVYALLEVEEIETSVRKAFKVRILKNNENWDIFISAKGKIIMEEKITSANS